MRLIGDDSDYPIYIATLGKFLITANLNRVKISNKMKNILNSSFKSKKKIYCPQIQIINLEARFIRNLAPKLSPMTIIPTALQNSTLKFSKREHH